MFRPLLLVSLAIALAFASRAWADDDLRMRRLIEAIDRGDEARFTEALSRVRDVEAEVEGVTPLYRALREGRPAFVKALLARGASPNHTFDGSTVFAAALEDGLFPEDRLADVQAAFVAAIEAGAKIERGYSAPPACTAASERFDAVLAALFARGVNAHLRCGTESLLSRALASARARPLAPVLTLLFAHGVKVDEVDAAEGSALHLLARATPDPAALKLLLANGASLEARDADGRTPLLVAAAEGKDVTPWLAAGARVDAVDRAGAGALALAAGSTGDELALANVQRLLAAKAPATVKDAAGQLASARALLAGNMKTFELLHARETQAGAKGDVDPAGVATAVAVDYAARVRLVLENGGSVDGTDVDGEPLVVGAIRRGDRDVLNLVLDHGGVAQLERHAMEAWRALRETRAAATDPAPVEALVDMLLARGLPLEAHDDQGATPLMAAIRAKDAAFVQLLLTKGADVKAKAADGTTVGELARDSGSAAVLRAVYRVLPAANEPPAEAEAIVFGSGPGADDGWRWAERWTEAHGYLARYVTLADGYPLVTRSDDVPGLEPGEQVAILGYCAPGAAEAVLPFVRALGADAVVRKVTVPGGGGSCPQIADGAAVLHSLVLPAKDGTRLAVTEFPPMDDDDHDETQLLVSLRRADGELASAHVLTGMGVADKCRADFRRDGSSLVLSLHCALPSRNNCLYRPYEATTRWSVSPAGKLVEKTKSTFKDRPVSCAN